MNANLELGSKMNLGEARIVRDGRLQSLARKASLGSWPVIVIDADGDYRVVAVRVAEALGLVEIK